MSDLKAYIVSCGDDDHGAKVTYAVRSKSVDRTANSDICDCEYISRRVKRAEEFDKYAPHGPTAAEYLAEGWYWQCSSCERHLHEDDKPLISDDDAIYCSIVCVDRLIADFQKHSPAAHNSIFKALASAERLRASTETVQ